MAKVTIGMPVWNGATYVSDSIDSILAQTYDDFELLISDNASSDATAEICLRYDKLDPRIRYVRQQANIGANPNHTYVFRHSTSPYFKWAAHDDMLAPTFLEKCVRVLDSDEGIINCTPDTLLIGEDGSSLQRSTHDGVLVDGENIADLASADVVERFAAAVLHAHSCEQIYGVTRRTALERTLIMPSYVGGNKVLMVQLSLVGRFCLLHEPLFYRRYHKSQGGSKDPGTSLHTLKMAAEYLRTIAAAELTGVQRARCLGLIGRRLVTRTLYGPNRSGPDRATTRINGVVTSRQQGDTGMR
jgi:glycosyltransferase involved in cell wall biosynthesis